MAESEEQVQQQEAGGQQDDASQASSGGGKQKLIVIGILLLLLIVVSAVLYLVFFSQNEANIATAGGEHSKYIVEYLKRQQVSIEQIRQEGKPLFSKEFEFTANMAGGRNTIKLLFRATLYDTLARDYLENRSPEINDHILELLKKTKPKELRNRAGLELLKLQIFRILNAVYSDKFIELSESKDRSPVKDILITQYYVN